MQLSRAKLRFAASSASFSPLSSAFSRSQTAQSMGKERRGTEHAAPARGPRHHDFEKRGCTDVLCLLLFILFWVVNFVTGDDVVLFGRHQLAQLGTDYLGNRCGVGEYADRPKTWFPRMSVDFAQVGALMESTPWAAPLYGLCVDECPTCLTPRSPTTASRRRSTAPTRAPRSGRSTWTPSAMNRCVPTTPTNSTTTALCTVPGCDEAEEECVNLQVLELPPRRGWCARARRRPRPARGHPEAGSTVVQANAGPVWDTSSGGQPRQRGAAHVQRADRRDHALGVASSLICGGWLLFLFFLGWLAAVAHALHRRPPPHRRPHLPVEGGRRRRVHPVPNERPRQPDAVEPGRPGGRLGCDVGRARPLGRRGAH